MVPSTHPKPNRKLIIWLNGGPGCSSMDGLFMEHGPFRVLDPTDTEEETLDQFDIGDNEKEKEMPRLVVNPYSWHRHTTMVFLDQPVGTGYSLEGEENKVADLTMDKIVEGFVGALDGLMKVWPEFRKYDLYLSGESFAGVYVPHFASMLIKRGDADVTKRYRLKGLAIGNGALDPLRQYTSYTDFALKHNIINSTIADQQRPLERECTEQLLQKERMRIPTCFQILINIMKSTKDSGMCVNRYDVRLRDKDDQGECGLTEWPPGVKGMARYLSRADVRKALHADKGRKKKGGWDWRECNHAIGKALQGDEAVPSYRLFPELLERVRITLFNGDMDLSCNVIGIQRMIDNLEWGGSKGMNTAPFQTWTINAPPPLNINITTPTIPTVPALKPSSNPRTIGTIQSRSNLTHVVLKGASHMASVDSPDAVLMVLERIVLELARVDDVVIGDEVLAGVKMALTFAHGSSQVSTEQPKALEPTPSPPATSTSQPANVTLIVVTFFLVILVIILLVLALRMLSKTFGVKFPSFFQKGYASVTGAVSRTLSGSEWHELTETEYTDIFVAEEDEIPEQSTSAGVNVRFEKAKTPPEYCSFGPSLKECKAWLRLEDPELFISIYGEEELGLDKPFDPKAADQEKQKAEGEEGGSKKTKKEKKPKVNKIEIKKSERAFKKSAVQVIGLQNYGVDLKQAAKLFGKKFACGASVTKSAAGADEIVIQGDFMYEVAELICMTWPDIKEKYIDIKD
ncbi:Cell death protease [Phlyctochytrium planicorne]|nr:Cell death protease [Phlyctochytrium planicorne]